MKVKSLYTAKETVNKTKITLRIGENICKKAIDKGLIS